MQNQTIPELTAYIDELVAFLLRSGDIDNRKAFQNDMEAISLESKARKKIKADIGENYQEKYTIDSTFPMDDFTLRLKGKADGIVMEAGEIVIDEVKCIFLDLDAVKAPDPLHISEVKCYAYIYSLVNHIDALSIQVTYYNVETEDLKKFRYKTSFEELKVFFTNLLCSYKKWARFQLDWSKIKLASIHGLDFPFEYRNGQKNFVVSVYKSILRKKMLFVQAPTGIGKTVSNIFPSVKAVGEGLSNKIFYLTAKNITRAVAIDTFKLLANHGLRFKVLEITSKEKICTSGEVDCNPLSCPAARGHFDRINQAVYHTLTSFHMFTKEVIVNAAQSYQVCPYLLCLDLSLWADAVVCDYNYVFAPNVQLTYFFNDRMKKKYIFLIDEAHNLVDRGRDMYSASLYKEDVLEIKNLTKPYSKALAQKLETCNKYLLKLKRSCETYCILTEINSFQYKIIGVICEMERLLTSDEGGLPKELKKTLMNFYFSLSKFLYIMDQLDENYIIYCEHEDDGKFKLKLFCVNTAHNLQQCMDKSRSSILFSATLLPIHYYKSMLSTRADNYAIYVDSPFDTSKRLIMIAKDVSSKYTRRNEAEYRKIAVYIARAAEKKAGNYIVFFPSFQFLHDVHKCFLEEYPSSGMDLLLQGRNMDEEAKAAFLQNFKDKRNILGFCVMGGVFSEGIDLKGDALIGSIIVGTGLPQVCNERELIKYFYDRSYNHSGFQYGYLYPAINKVLQAGGRVIRTVNDTGIILLLDERFQMPQYTSLFPAEWQENYSYCTIDTVSDELDRFWKNQL